MADEAQPGTSPAGADGGDGGESDGSVTADGVEPDTTPAGADGEDGARRCSRATPWIARAAITLTALGAFFTIGTFGWQIPVVGLIGSIGGYVPFWWLMVSVVAADRASGRGRGAEAGA
jgi:hypothetical protein